MRTTIYIPDELVEEVKESAWRSRKSVSEYLLDLHRATRARKEIKQTESYVGKSESKIVSEPIFKEKKVIKTVDDVPETFRSYSKDQQLGKKGAK